MPKKSPDAPAEIQKAARDHARSLKLSDELDAEIARVHQTVGVDIKAIKAMLSRRADQEWLGRVDEMWLEDTQARLKAMRETVASAPTPSTSAPKVAKATETPVP